MTRPMSDKQREMLLAYHNDGEATDLCDFNGQLGWHNRERTINALYGRGYLDADGVTDAGRKALGVSK